MVYAALFGIADKMMKQMERVYPDRIPELEEYNRQVVIAHSCYRSIYGGGGFSGGGHGGGLR